MLSLVSVTVALPQFAEAECPISMVIDDFSSGKYKATLKGVSDTGDVIQIGSMLGGNRMTFFQVGFNAFNQHANLTIDPKSSIMLVGSGVRTNQRLEIFYGLDIQKGQVVPNSLHQDMSCFSTFRIHFDANSLGLNLNMQVVANNNPVPAQCGVNIDGDVAHYGMPFTVDLPFDCFTPNVGPAPDFHKINLIDLIIQTGSTIGANDYGITLIEAVP